MLIDEDIEKPTTEKSKDSPTEQKDYSDLTDKELNIMMQESIDNEDYETASKIRDELNKRKK